MKELKGTKTEKNLQEAFAGESQARNKYTYFASKARKEGYEQIADIFEETARNEKEHAQNFGSSILRAATLRIPQATSRLPQQERTSSGPTCTTAWLRRPTRKGSRRLQLSSAW